LTKREFRGIVRKVEEEKGKKNVLNKWGKGHHPNRDRGEWLDEVGNLWKLSTEMPKSAGLFRGQKTRQGFQTT